MRGQKRTKEEQHELFLVLEGYLKMGFSLKKASSLADIPYSTMRDITSAYEPLRAHTRALQNSVNVTARANIISSIEQGNINDSKWWLERFDHLEPQESPIYGGIEEGLLTMLETKAEAEDGRDADRLADMKEFLLGSMV
jgi:hypothetical protein